MKIKAIPNIILNKKLKFSGSFKIPIEKMIRGILKSKTIALPIEKLNLLSKFIDAEIDPKQDKINDPILKVINNKSISFVDNPIIILAIGIDIKKGI
tara:strand:+ start:185 stop:475 length:291 start_codon:yes stop_codon:yes gene_type:complete